MKGDIDMTTTFTTNNFIESILPTFGQPRTANTPIWNEAMHMFIINEHESAAGNRSYDGIRIADRFVIIEHIGHYHSFTYINGVEIYAFDGSSRQLIAKDQLDTYYNKELIRATTEKMLKDYIASQMKLVNAQMPEENLNNQVKCMIDSSYKSFFDPEYARRIESMKSLLLESK